MQKPETYAAAIAVLAKTLGNSEAAQLAAHAMLEAEAKNLPRFGLDLLHEYAPVAGQLPAFSGSVSQLDYSGIFAPVAVAHATLGLAQRAQEHGIAAAFLSSVKGVGRLAPFVAALADRGFFAIAGAEAPPIVAPSGGTKPAIGTNPIAFAAGKLDRQIVIDTATAALTMAEMKLAKASGAPLRENVALDAAGNPTLDANAIAAILPKGGQIGSLLGLIVEILGGIAGRGMRSNKQGRGIFIIAIADDLSAEGARERLIHLRDSWRDAGGYWPGQGRLVPQTPLPDTIATRLTDWLSKLDELP